MSIVKVEIGPGFGKISKEWVTIGDFEREGIVDHVASWGADALPLMDKSVDMLYASHCLEHVPWFQVDYALSEAYRVLKDGATIEIHVPDLGYLVECYMNGNSGDDWMKFDNQEHSVKWFASRLISYGPTLSNYHKSCFDQKYLTFCLKKAGFTEVEKIQHSRAHRLHGKINLGLRATK